MSSIVSTIKSPLIDDTYRAILDGLLSDIKSGSIVTLAELRLAYLQKVVDYYKAEGIDVSLQLYGWEEYRNPSIHNANQATIASALKLLNTETLDLSKTVTAYYNYSTKATYDVSSRAKAIDAKLTEIKEHNIDLRQFAAAGRSTIILSDDFTDLSKIDFSKSSDIYANLGDSRITLSPQQNVNRAINVTDIQVLTNKSSNPGLDLNAPSQLASIAGSVTDPAGDDGLLPTTPRAYEGYRFAPVGSARPEGGAWRIETANSRANSDTNGVSYKTRYSDLTAEGAALNANIISALGEPYVPPVAASDTSVSTKYVIYTRIANSSDTPTLVMDTAIEVSNAAVDPPYVMIGDVEYDFIQGWTASLPNGDTVDYDKSADTANEYLAVKVPGTATTTEALNKYDHRYTPEGYIFDEPLGNTGVSYNTTDANLLVSSDLQYEEIAPSKELATLSRLRMTDGDARTFWEIEYTPFLAGLQAVVDSTAIERKQAASTFIASAGYDPLVVTLIFKLDASYTLNYIDLTPVYFTDYQLAPITVTGVYVDNVEITGGVQNKIEITSNDTGLPTSAVVNNGITDPYAYRGKAFVEFSPRQVTEIKLVIRQDKPVANYYELYNYQLVKKSTYTISQSYSSSSSSSKMFGKTKSSSLNQSDGIVEKGTATIMFQDGYLETIVKTSGASSNNTTSGNNLSFSTGGGSGSGSQSQLGSLLGSVGGLMLGGALGGAVGGFIGGMFNKGSSSSTSSSGNRSYTDSGWQTGLDFNRAIWSRPRYAIGISEVGFYSRSYKTIGTFYSTQYTVPAGNKVARLEVREDIPTSFLSYSQTQAFIEYYLVVGDQEIRIKPEKGADASIAHEGLPTELDLSTISSGKTSLPVRIKAVVKRPDGRDFPDASSLTPSLNYYKIIIEDKL